ncbi:hypothetical protein BK120_22970 [Paenibacillus sp. FSL A5-0031]|uniref:hypothetical protein n=1 Tax=Paenibacillus sp. FSL A5-0031 TaxID=1920420 RepID=UPI00096E105C|nr:hypothetical protein [Paenibacillus sp. FSL A5-0031]OME78604.1 hypothetical protein BK120_22970 [Paenibacillus sp. FSL A5-0031]
MLQVKRFVMLQIIIAILATLSCEKVRLFAIRNRGVSLNHPPLLPSWYSDKSGIQKRAKGKDLVFVDIPMSLLFSGDEPYHSVQLRCSIYKLKGIGLRYAKRGCRTLKVAS